MLKYSYSTLKYRLNHENQINDITEELPNYEEYTCLSDVHRENIIAIYAGRCRPSSILVPGETRMAELEYVATR